MANILEALRRAPPGEIAGAIVKLRRSRLSRSVGTEECAEQVCVAKINWGRAGVLATGVCMELSS